MPSEDPIPDLKEQLRQAILTEVGPASRRSRCDNLVQPDECAGVGCGFL